MANVDYAVTSNWGAGFIGNMTVPGGTQGLDGWTVAFDASFDITNIWGAEIISHVGNHYVVRGLSWDSNVPAGGQAAFGFQATTGTGGTAATGLILNGGGSVPPTLPTLSVADVSAKEGNAGTSKLAFTVTLSQASATPVTVHYATANGTATAGSDYTALTGTLTFAAGETSKVINVSVAGDTLIEANETLTLALSSPSGATIVRGSATGTIVNDDVALPTLSVANASVKEGNAGASTLAFTVTLSQASATPVTVKYATANGTATAGSDYTAGSGTLIFAAGETSKVVNVSVAGDTLVEANETLTLALSSPSGATIARGSATGTIVNDDVALPTLSVADASVKEGNAGTSTLAFTVTLSQSATTPVTVHYATANGTATAGSDYTAGSGTLTFAAGETSKVINVSVAGDTLVEANETLTLALSSPSGATIARGSATGTIVNDDVALPTLSVADTSVKEGNAGASMLAFTVTLSQASATPVTVKYATANGTATAGLDYTAGSGTLTFAAGETSKVVNVSVAGDTLVENDETLLLTLAAASGATIAHGSATGTIVNDDVALPTVSVADASVTEGNAGHAALAFTVTLSQAATGAVSVHYATTDGTATAGSDYTAGSGTLTFAAGETSKVVNVSVAGDTLVEGNETLTLNLSSPSGATIGDGSATGTILDDDAPAGGLPALSISDTSVVEGSPGAGSAAPGWLSTSGNQIVDSAGHSVQIAGVNWFGFQSSNMSPDGLWTRGYKDMMNQMVGLGFNTIRLPFSSEMLHSTAVASGIDYSKNPDLQGLTGLQVMDKIVSYADQIGLKIILDHHRSESGGGTSENGLWYDSQYSDAQWVADWKMLATRYANDSSVIGADLHNEPYNGTWGGGGANDWVAAAERAGNAIGSVNSNWLVFVEGVGTYKGDSYWWGGNLEGVRDDPVVLNVPNKLVYSPHDYPDSVYAQPWFQGADFAQQLPAKFEQEWGYIYQDGIAPVYVGEFGTRLTDPKDAPWLEALTSYIGGDFNNDGTSDLPAGDQGISWTYWAWNPNSSDTGGILADDWNTVNQNKLAYLTPIEFDFDKDVQGGDGSGSTPTPHADFVLTLSKPATQTITVGYHTVPGTATSADFVASQGTVTFAPGDQNKTISIAITPDTLGEANEQFSVVLTDPSGATLARATGTATIVDDDGGIAPPPVVPDPPPSNPTPPTGDLQASLSVVDSWSGGFNGSVTLHNDAASATAGWQVEVDTSFQITDIWNAQILSHDASGYVIGNAAWNGAIAHAGDTNFGFVASGQGDPSATHIGPVG